MYTPKFLRRSIWSICIGFDGITIYTEFDGRVYRVVSETNAQVFITDLPMMYPGLFKADSTRYATIDIYTDLSLLPQFDQSLPSPLHKEHRHWFATPD